MKLDEYLSNLDAETEPMVERIMQWANINTSSFNVPGLERMAAVLTQEFSVLECEGNAFSLPPIEHVDSMGMSKRIDIGPALRFWKRPEAPVQVLLVGHMDTVFELEHPFQVAIRKDERVLQGPGVTDMKGGICIMLEALKLFEKSPNASQLGWEVIINPDEEIGSFGSGPLLEERAKAHHVGLLFEPAMDDQGTLAGDRKGCGNFVFIVHGRAAHAGRAFDQGRNAIAMLAEVITQVDALNGQRDGVTLNVGHVQGGGATNVVPPLAICRLDVRIKQTDDHAWVLDHLNAITAAANQKKGFKTELKGSFNRKPKALVGKTKALYDLLAEVGQELGDTISWKPSGGCCDGNNLSDAGLPNIDTLGVCGGNIHSDEEYLLVNSLVPRAKLTAALLLRLSEGKFK
ncbi:MAG TPA: hydrolase [Gammaproteobacteria bacterium]|nr:hydrolase [Gammaproteobacteria bacterium]